MLGWSTLPLGPAYYIEIYIYSYLQDSEVSSCVVWKETEAGEKKNCEPLVPRFIIAQIMHSYMFVKRQKFYGSTRVYMLFLNWIL